MLLKTPALSTPSRCIQAAAFGRNTRRKSCGRESGGSRRRRLMASSSVMGAPRRQPLFPRGRSTLLLSTPTSTAASSSSGAAGAVSPPPKTMRERKKGNPFLVSLSAPGSSEADRQSISGSGGGGGGGGEGGEERRRRRKRASRPCRLPAPLPPPARPQADRRPHGRRQKPPVAPAGGLGGALGPQRGRVRLRPCPDRRHRGAARLSPPGCGPGAPRAGSRQGSESRARPTQMRVQRKIVAVVDGGRARGEEPLLVATGLMGSKEEE